MDEQLIEEISQTEITQKKIDFLDQISKNFPVLLAQEISWNRNSIYGEIVFNTLEEILARVKHLCNLEDGGIFYDLGSGIGKVVISAAIFHNFAVCIGVELLPELYKLSLRLQHKYIKHKVKYYWSKDATDDIRFINEDIFSHDWSMATCFFANSTCFDDEMMIKISNYPVRPGTIGITTTKRLLKSSWQLLESSHKNMTWGKAKVFIQKKI
jgi:Histone methylation protein DOT1